MKIRVQVLNKEGWVVDARKKIDMKDFKKEIHRHLSGREFTSDELKGFNSASKADAK